MRLHPEIERLNVTTTKREVLRKDQLLTGSYEFDGDEELYEDDDDDWDPYKKDQPQHSCKVLGSHLSSVKYASFSKSLRTYLVPL
jgi:hypothetical protein